MHKNMLNLIGLLDLDADADAVDRRLDQHLLVLITRYHQWVQQHFGRRLSLYLGYVMAFGGLRGEVG